MWISEQTATFALYIINWLAFITVVENVYCAVRNWYLIQSRLRFVFKRLKCLIKLSRLPDLGAFSVYTIFFKEQERKWNNFFLTPAEFFRAGVKWNEIKVAEEYCWAKTLWRGGCAAAVPVPVCWRQYSNLTALYVRTQLTICVRGLIKNYPTRRREKQANSPVVLHFS